MTLHLDAELSEWALGILPETDRTRVEAHLAVCTACAAEARALTEAASSLAFASAQLAPSPQVLHRLLAAAEGRGRLARYADALAQFFQIGVDKANALLDAVDEPRAWLPDASGIGLIHLEAGPAFAGADAGLVRFPAGMAWGLHKHLGEERHLFLEGGIVEDETGLEYRAGDVLVKAAGTQHSFHVMPGTDCVTAVLLLGGIEMPPGTPVSF